MEKSYLCFFGETSKEESYFAFSENRNVFFANAENSVEFLKERAIFKGFVVSLVLFPFHSFSRLTYCSPMRTGNAEKEGGGRERFWSRQLTPKYQPASLLLGLAWLLLQHGFACAAVLIVYLGYVPRNPRCNKRRARKSA